MVDMFISLVVVVQVVTATLKIQQVDLVVEVKAVKHIQMMQ